MTARRTGYAVDTKVPVRRTKVEIEDLILKRGGTSVATLTDANRAMIAFQMKDLRVVFKLPLPDAKKEQEVRSRWRGLLLCIKAKFEAVDRGVETFEEAFLSHVMAEDGRTVAEHAVPRLREIVSGSVPLLPPPTK